MNLWIRSTARTNLVKCDCLSIINGSEVYDKNKWEYNGYTICQCYNNHNYTLLGTYKTKERALEVLDEIQETMCLDKFNYEDKDKTCYQDCYRYKSDIIAIYEMPKE